jgi:AraC-like DNA-binding protein
MPAERHGTNPETTGYTIPIRRVQTFLALATHHGWDIEPMLETAGISPALLAEGRSRVTIEQAAKLLEALWLASDDELLGLGPMPVPRGTFRLVAHALMATARDVDSMFARFEEFNRALPGIPGVRIIRGDSETSLVFDLTAIDHPVDLLIDTLLAASHRLLEWGIDRRVRLIRVEVPYPRPEDLDDYHQIFAAPIIFDASHAVLVFDSQLLTAPTVRDENDLNTFLAQPVELLARRDYGTTTSDLVRQLTARAIGHDWPTAEQIADGVRVSPRTLRRKLEEENTTLRQIREEVLRDTAIESLARGAETIAALSERLGFSEPSAFTRAFRRWTGSAPRSYQPHDARD